MVALTKVRAAFSGKILAHLFFLKGKVFSFNHLEYFCTNFLSDVSELHIFVKVAGKQGLATISGLQIIRVEPYVPGNIWVFLTYKNYVSR